jgi:threonine synthase
VLVITGEGLKTLDAVAPHVGPGATIPASAAAFEAAGLV